MMQTLRYRPTVNYILNYLGADLRSSVTDRQNYDSNSMNPKKTEALLSTLSGLEAKINTAAMLAAWRSDSFSC